MKDKKKETQVLALLADGLTSKEIGQKLEISHRTVERHIELTRAVYGAKNIPQLIAIAFREKLIK